MISRRLDDQVECHDSPMLIGLYIASFVLELLGLLLVALEIRDKRNSAIALLQAPRPQWSMTTHDPRSGFDRRPQDFIDPEGAAKRRQRQQALTEQSNVMASYQAYDRLVANLVEVLSGGRRRAWVGLALLFLGLSVGLAANLVSTI